MEKEELNKVGPRVANVAMLLVGATLISRVLGYVREILIYSNFGQNRITDAYNAAFSIPDFVYLILVGGALSSAFVPVYTSYLAKKQEKEAWRLANVVITVVSLLLLIAILISNLFLPQIISTVIAPGFDAPSLQLTVNLTRIMFFQTMFMCYSGITMGILYSYKLFWPSAVGSVLYNVGILIIGVLLAKQFGIYAFAFGVVGGALLYLLAQTPALRKQGYHFKPSLNFRHEGFKQVISLMLPIFVGLSISQISLFVNQNMASRLPGGLVAALSSGQKLMSLPIAIFAVSIGVAAFPMLSEVAAKKDFDKYNQLLTTSMGNMFFLTIPSTAGFIALATPIVRLMYESGKFTASATAATAYTLVCFSFGIATHGSTQVLNRAFYALRDTRTPMILASISMGVNIIFNFLLIGPMKQGGLALGYSISGFVNMLLLFFFIYKKQVHIELRKIISTLIRSVVAATVMGVSAYAIVTIIALRLDMSVKTNQLIQVLAGLVVAFIVYFTMTWLLKMEEIKQFTRKINKKISTKQEESKW